MHNNIIEKIIINNISFLVIFLIISFLKSLSNGIYNNVKNAPIKKEIIAVSGINAGPAVRKYARELEIDLTKINGTGKNKRITKEDLKNFIHSSKEPSLDMKTYKESDFSDEGKYSLQKMSKIRVLGAKNVQAAWNSIPHVTHFDEINHLRKYDQVKFWNSWHV